MFYNLSMKRFSLFTRFFVLVLLLSSTYGSALGFAQDATVAPSATAKIQVYFSPKGGAQDAIVREIDAAKVSIRIQAFNYSSVAIGKALIAAQKRGLTITALLDRSNQSTRYTGGTFLQNAGATVLTDGKHKIAHSKIMILDSGTPTATVITGSFNFTKSAELSNAENLLVIKEAPDLVKSYDANFDAHMTHAVPYVFTGSTLPVMSDDDNDETEAPTTPITPPVGTKPVTVTPPVTPTAPPVTVTSGKVNINTATAKELEKLPGIGKVSAQRIIEYREANGGFKSVQELDKVQGIGKATLEKLRDLVTIG